MWRQGHVSSSTATQKAAPFCVQHSASRYGELKSIHPSPFATPGPVMLFKNGSVLGQIYESFFKCTASSAPSSRQVNFSVEHPPSWCCLQARCASSCLRMPTDLCIQLLTQVPPGQRLKLPDLQHPSCCFFQGKI